ncbi:helix-turn-helix domain-containing protein [Rickettsia hoogstraalii]|uniref:helix-turn-helix domain-containing protein n=1 Tax=Rickettsia hoogstraalii TaxID=467174 RepID=UPI000B083EA6|nr:helix-turn-helix transcriptional regulator [Rickettsia hoogstraalii]
MKLEEYIDITGISPSEMAVRIGVSQSHIHKYLHEKAIPRLAIMHRIYLATSGLVTPNDFYDFISDSAAKESLKQLLKRLYQLLKIEK